MDSPVISLEEEWNMNQTQSHWQDNDLNYVIFSSNKMKIDIFHGIDPK